MQTYTAVPTDEVIDRTVETLKSRTNIDAVVAENGAQALEMLIRKIPERSEIFPSSLTTWPVTPTGIVTSDRISSVSRTLPRGHSCDAVPLSLRTTIWAVSTP